VLSPITLSQSQTSLTTGKGHQDAKAASGTVTFYNGSNTAHTINAGTVFTGNDGIQVATDQDATIPAANLPVVGQATVTAHALKANAKGNIQAYDVNLAISSDLTVKNLSHFTGGQDERTFQTVTKQDISNVAMTLKISLAQSMRGALIGQVQSGEALVTPPCTPQVTADHRPGEEATRVKVTVSETCSAVTYDTQSLNTRVTQLLTTQAAETLGTGYSLIGGVRVSGIQATITHKQHPLVFLSFHSQGIWVYALSQRAQQRIKTLIAGKTKQEAVHLLESQPGIERVSLHWSGFGDDTRIPKNISYIHLALFYGL